MSFDPDEDQRELVALVRGVLDQRADSAATRRALDTDERFDVDLWRLLCEEIGIAGMAIPEEFGGAGFTLREAQLVLEEIGASSPPPHTSAPSPSPRRRSSRAVTPRLPRDCCPASRRDRLRPPWPGRPPTGASPLSGWACAPRTTTAGPSPG
ncbi:acyl-CoA dehydrogenase family protein [Microbacterium sp. Se5.02b]|uniref:acyl-CoA dehydrogenase family protein n=1 Tax=Microbacterium sp. Se5.02b TaxID=2864103 RepID=UPI001C68EA12|nr:acyl-CoA dehydrogenase family protein [Microbacterium sp. Se5.02b]QYM63958.1 acyl-CoA dehydrogenase family protein [Microbacterium sp. Se5.02b]